MGFSISERRLTSNFATSGVAVIIGAGSGIGKQTALSFARNGAVGVVFADIDFEAARDAASESASCASNDGFKGCAFEVDVAERQSVDDLMERVVAKFGRISYCVNCAGIPTLAQAPMADMQDEVFQRIQRVNVDGTYNVSQAALRVMRKQERQIAPGYSGPRDLGRGVIVNTSSVCALSAMSNMGPYVAAKHAILGLSKTMAIEYGSHGIRTCALCPGWTRTPMMEYDLRQSSQLDEMIRRSCPLGRMAEAEEIADAVLFLCSPAGSFMNGPLVVDGGLTTGIM